MTKSTALTPQQTPAEPAQALVAVPQHLVAAANRLDHLSRAIGRQLAEADGDFGRAMVMSAGVQALREAVTPEIVKAFMPLMGLPTGFGTDRPPGGKREPYTAAELKEPLIQSLLLGFRPVNKEWMVFQGQCFGCKAGWRRKLSELPGVTDIEIVSGLPRLVDGAWTVRVAVRWKKDGRRDCLADHEGKPGRLFVIAHQGDRDRAEQVAGKAEARALRAAYHQAIGQRCDDEEDGANLALPAGDQPRSEAVLNMMPPAPAATQAAPPRLATQTQQLTDEQALTRLDALLAELDPLQEEWEDMCRAADSAADPPFTPQEARNLIVQLEKYKAAKK